MNFIWLDINASWSHSSLALPALHAQLSAQTKQKSNLQAISGTIKSNLSEIVEQVCNAQPTYIFATAWLFNTVYINEVLCRVNQICHPKGIFLGGPEFLQNNEEFLQNNKHITAVFKGEGEEMFEEFITSLLNQDNKWKQIEGFEYIQNCIYHKSKIVYVKNFAALIPAEESSLFNWNKSFVQLETSRGCFNTCRFCVSGIDKTKSSDIPIEALDKRLQNIKNHSIKQVRILDRTFNANPQRAVDLINLFSKYQSSLKFHLEIHPALLHPKFKEALSTIPQGLLHVEAGIQTLRQDVLDACARKGSCKNAIEGLKYLIDLHKFEVHADLIAGLPGYSYQQLIEDTLTMMNISPAEIQLESLKLLPGTYFRIYSKELKISYSPLPPYEILNNEQISYSQLNKSMVISKIIDFWYNDTKWQQLFKQIFANNKQLFIQLINYLHNTEYISKPLSLESKGLLLYKFCKNYSPDKLSLISLQWIKNGLSIKKEPAQELQQWNYQDKTIKNPFLEPTNETAAANNVAASTTATSKSAAASVAANETFLKKTATGKDLIYRYKYYYLKVGNTVHWFSFNKEIERVAPCGYIKIEENN